MIDGGATSCCSKPAKTPAIIKAGLLAIQRLGEEYGFPIPTMVSGTIEATGTMLAGQTADAFYTSLSHAPLLSIGPNCATVPEFMNDHIRSIHELATTRISCYPNAGLPDEEGQYAETPTTLASQLERFVNHGWLNIVGGCTGHGQITSGLSRRWSKAKRRALPKNRVTGHFSLGSKWWRRKTAPVR